MKTIKATVAAQIFIPASQVKPALEKFIKKELVFFNPKIIELKRLGYSTWKVPKVIKCYRQLKSGYFLPLGFGPRFWRWCQEEKLKLILDDQRIVQPVEKIKSQITLKENQLVALNKILPKNRAILQAKPGFGKTVLALAYIVQKQQKTLIIVHTRALLAQWQKRIADFLELETEDIGIIGEGKWQIGRKITIASYQTLLSRGTKEINNLFGLVVVDECHHVPANTFAKVVRDFSAKYCLGLTATPFRKDKLDRLMNFYIGSIITTDQLETSDEQSLLPPAAVKTVLLKRETDLWIQDFELKDFTQLGTILSEDQNRLQLIINDVLTVAKDKNHRLLVLSERVGHCEALFTALKKLLPKSKMVLVTGQMKKAEREKLFEKIKKNNYQIMVATGGVVGEGFDWPEINYLFLTFPFSWRGRLIQYVGRAQRVSKNKTQAFVYDYVDEQMSIFQAMWRKRLLAYRELGVVQKDLAKIF